MLGNVPLVESSQLLQPHLVHNIMSLQIFDLRQSRINVIPIYVQIRGV